MRCLGISGIKLFSIRQGMYTTLLHLPSFSNVPALSMSAVASNYRYTWVAMNPWNGVEGIAFTVGYFLHTGKTVSMLITIGLLLVIWWRLYALIHRTFIR